MGELKEFLKEQAHILRTQPRLETQKRDEWIKAFVRLIQQIRKWLLEVDPDQAIFEIEETTFSILEAGIGGYTVPGLFIRFGRSEVRVEPISHQAFGDWFSLNGERVSNLYGQVNLVGIDRYELYRIETNPEDRWAIYDPYYDEATIFNQESFERAFKMLV